MRLSIFVGDLADAPAEVVCTSTNPRLSLMMGTGASIRERGGFGVLRECERVVEEYRVDSGRTELPIGSVHVTTAGDLPFRAVIHCVASGDSHRSSPAIVRVCTRNAIQKAAALHAASVALPVFGSGHARVPFSEALRAIAEGVRDCEAAVEHVVIVIHEQERAREAKAVLENVLDCDVGLM
jgi:O-acetyl-ADP-ribose deacetylase